MKALVTDASTFQDSHSLFLDLKGGDKNEIEDKITHRVDDAVDGACVWIGSDGVGAATGPLPRGL